MERRAKASDKWFVFGVRSKSEMIRPYITGRGNDTFNNTHQQRTKIPGERGRSSGMKCRGWLSEELQLRDVDPPVGFVVNVFDVGNVFDGFFAEMNAILFDNDPQSG